MAGIVNFNPLRASDANGDPVSGAKAYFYESGTTTPVDVFSDKAGTVAHASPLIADASGIFPPVYYTGNLKVVITSADDVAVPGYSLDYVSISSLAASQAASVGFSPIIENTEINVQDAIENISNRVAAEAANYASAAQGVLADTAIQPTDTHDQATWNTGTSTDERLISPEKLQDKLFNVKGALYDYQEFLVSGNWIKPVNAEIGDTVVIQTVGAGASGDLDSTSGGDGGGGGAGAFISILIELLNSTEAVVVGVGGTSRTSSGVGIAGGKSSFGTINTTQYLASFGGQAPSAGDSYRENEASNGLIYKPAGSGDGGATAEAGNPSEYGGGGGGGTNATVERSGGISQHSGRGGDGKRGASAVAEDGSWPGGGGGSAEGAGSVSGAGADGVVRVWCYRSNS